MVRNEESVCADMKAHIESKIEGIDETTSVWTEKNQDRMRRMETAKHDKQTERNDLATKLAEKQSASEAEEFAFKAREAEKKRRAENKARDEALATAKYNSATRLQAAIKAFFTRQALAVLKKKMGKKKR